MTISNRCVVCKDADKRRLIEAGWNAGLSAVGISDAMGGSPTSKSILSHLHDHAEGIPAQRLVDVDTRTVRERVLELQETQLKEVERRIAMAKQRAAELNAWQDEQTERGIVPESGPFVRHDWSEFYDILHKDNQAAIGTILKTQGLSDKREKATADLKLGLFESMARAGLAPKGLVGGEVAKRLLPGDEGEEETPDE